MDNSALPANVNDANMRKQQQQQKLKNSENISFVTVKMNRADTKIHTHSISTAHAFFMYRLSFSLSTS